MIPRTPAERLLKQYYAEITPLRAYLERLVLCAEGNQLLREGDGQAYRQLLEETLVATAVEEAKEMPLRAMTASQGAQDMSEVVTRALHAIFFGSNANRANVLAQGYQVGLIRLLANKAQGQIGCLSQRLSRTSKSWRSSGRIYQHTSHSFADVSGVADSAR